MKFSYMKLQLTTGPIVVAFFVVLSLLLSPVSYATTLPAAGASGNATCGATLNGRYENRYSGSVQGRYPCGARAYGQCNTHTARGAARASFGLNTALARVQGSAKSTFDDFCEGSPGGGSDVALTATATYYLLIPLVAIPPPGYYGTPLPIAISGRVSGHSDSFTAGFSASMRLTGPGLNVPPWMASSEGATDVPIATTLLMDIDETVSVSLNATCSAGTSGTYGPFNSSCEATADPTFEFDQDAFDEMMGEDTFPLADYFTIAFSENLVPTPVGIDIAKFTNFNHSVDPYDATVPRIASGDTVTWTYEVENMGEIPIAEADLLVTDSDPGLTPVLDLASDDGDLILSPLETWEYTASAAALDLSVPPPGITVVPGCGDGRNTYENTALVEISGTEIFDEDVGHYCNDVAVADTDGDGIRDEQDNCIEVPNGPVIPDAGGNSQLDTDNDNIGNLCDGDLNNDGATNTLDLNLYKLAHRTSAGDADYNPDADFNGDGTINTLDLNIYKGLHRKPPGPSCCGSL